MIDAPPSPVTMPVSGPSIRAIPRRGPMFALFAANGTSLIGNQVTAIAIP